MKVKEQELKLLLDKDGFDYFLKGQPFENLLKQTNYYFDTKSLNLKNSGVTLRIREENNRLVMCMKLKITKDLFVTSEEFEQLISSDDLNKCIKNPEFISTLFSGESQRLLHSKTQGEKLGFLGFIKNNRYCINFIDGFTFELDHSRFPNEQQTYELEVEGISSKEDCNFIINKLKDHNIKFQLSDVSKYERFLLTIKNL